MDLLTHEELAQVLHKEKLNGHDLILLEHHIDSIGKLIKQYDLENDIKDTLKKDSILILERLETEYKHVIGVNFDEQ
jgi:hypothetical protein